MSRLYSWAGAEERRGPARGVSSGLFSYLFRLQGVWIQGVLLRSLAIETSMVAGRWQIDARDGPGHVEPRLVRYHRTFDQVLLPSNACARIVVTRFWSRCRASFNAWEVGRRHWRRDGHPVFTGIP